jgi:hypothetical protein
MIKVDANASTLGWTGSSLESNQISVPPIKEETRNRPDVLSDWSLPIATLVNVGKP